MRVERRQKPEAGRKAREGDMGSCLPKLTEQKKRANFQENRLAQVLRLAVLLLYKVLKLPLMNSTKNFHTLYFGNIVTLSHQGVYRN